MKPQRLLARLPRFMRGWVSYQNGKRPNDVPAWLLRVQRYRVMAHWYYAFGCSGAEEALAEATAKGYEVAGALEKHHFPLRNRASLMTRTMTRPKYPEVPHGISPLFHPTAGGLRGYKVYWTNGYTHHSRTFSFAKGEDLESAVKFRAEVEAQAIKLDEERMELFCELMSGLGAYLAEVAR